MFNSLMHLGFYTDHMDEMVEFYTKKLGGKLKLVTRFGVYKDRPDRGWMYEMAQSDPEKIFNVYVELAPGQFIEFFPSRANQAPHPEFDSQKGYSHFALETDDIFKTVEELKAKGVEFETEIKKGPSETWQIWCHDPDGNRFEIMQFTDKSWQVTGHGLEDRLQ